MRPLVATASLSTMRARQASARPTVITALPETASGPAGYASREDREGGTPTATIRIGLLPAACGAKNLAVSSS